MVSSLQLMAQGSVLSRFVSLTGDLAMPVLRVRQAFAGLAFDAVTARLLLKFGPGAGSSC